MHKLMPFAVLVALAGCGGSGSSTPSISNPFTGNYSGNYTSPMSRGTATITVTKDGTINGRFVEPVFSFAENLSGQITNSGSISGTLVPEGTVGEARVSGTLRLVQGNQYRTDLSVSANGRLTELSVTLTRN